MIELVAFAVLSGTPAKQGVDGGLPLAWVEEVISWRAAELAACFPPKGKRTSIQYSFGVSAAGRVERMTLGEVKGEWERVTCVGTIVESLSFPATDAGTSVNWAFGSTPSRDAGAVEERVLDVAEVPTEWTEDVTGCVAAADAVGRTTVALEVSALGFALASQVTTRPGPKEGIERCVTAATRSWRFSAGKRERVVAGWVAAPTEREVKKLFTPTLPAVEIILESARVKSGAEGGLPKSVIYAEIVRNQSRVRACYEMLLQRDAHAGGKVSVDFMIGPDGDVEKSEAAENTTGDAALAECILGVVNAMKFPKPEGGGNVNVTFPWIFKAAGD